MSPLHQVELQRHGFRRAVLVGLGAHPDHAIAQPPLQRTQTLPFEAVDRVARRVALRDDGTGEKPSSIVVVTPAAGQV